ncbi:ATP-binding cassette domain-containing protein [Candidatus Berkiella cookevillensis]|uniref:ABC transporter ATP-binding protein YtrE n=1 Tax=Candidatus Berkiella cookevillensis TaxID=437022 RepID=A0A0Q9YSF0_9GAMM|nr:ATP-binding cassette domain-containing protein [Candidatus Berkiella cookevillensis]MCS5707438.1 ATP-binding cassette domain-containing protein [Candidatus Berkiella cookevillensis]
MAILNVAAVSKQIKIHNKTLDILKAVDLRVNQSETIAILGSSGSGKTTLLGLLAGLDQPSAGSISLLGKEMTMLNEDERALLRLGQVGFVFQSFDLLPHLTALENVMLPLELAKYKKPKIKAQEMLCQVGLEKRLNHYPVQLSGGEQQRVAIARAFAIEPKILFADEPTGSLDENAGSMILDKLFDMNAQFKTTLVFVTHDLSVAKRCGAVYRLEHGILHLQ